MDPTPVQSANRTIIVVADDLIWASRLVAAAERAGARSLTVGSADELSAALRARLEAGDGPAPVIVDLAGRSYDGVEQVRTAAGAGSAVLAVGQHEDLALRREALAAGARRVFSYNKLFTDGPKVVAALLEGAL